MSSVISIIIFVVGIITGFMLMQYFMRQRHQHLISQANQASELDIAMLEERLRAKERDVVEHVSRIQHMDEVIDGLQRTVKSLTGDKASLEAHLSTERKQTEEKLTLLTQARDQLKHEFESLAQKIFEDKSTKFTAQNKDNMEQLLNPLREQIHGFKQKVEDVYDKESKDRVKLQHEIEHLRDLNQQTSEETRNLTNALRQDAKSQGNWGEMILEKVLESSGLRKGHEYDVQEKHHDEHGKRFHPDVVVHLPEEKEIIIDSKVSLTAYERYCSSETDDDKQRALDDHMASIRAHLKGLSAKRYEDLVGMASLDFVLMFIPIEGAFMLAVESDRQLYDDAYQQNIILVSPTTLFATLRTIDNMWRSEYQNRNAVEIARQAGNMLDKFADFAHSLEDVGKHLGRATDAYELAHKRLSTGKGNLVRRADQLRALGAKTAKMLPDSMQQDENEEDALPLVPQDTSAYLVSREL